MNHVQSPDTSDSAIEREIVAKGLNAPRLRPSDLDSNIQKIEYVTHTSSSGQVLRWAVLVLQNGFSAVGDPSVAVSSANDDEEIGKKVAFENSKQRLWPLMGYELKERLYQAQQPAQAPV